MLISEHKHMPEPVRRMEVFTGAGRRQSWSAAEKGAIIADSYGAGETVCSVARRHGLTPQQLFTWRRLARQAALSPATMFVPAVVDPVEPEPAGAYQGAAPGAPPSACRWHRAGDRWGRGSDWGRMRSRGSNVAAGGGSAGVRALVGCLTHYRTSGDVNFCIDELRVLIR